MNRRNIDWLIVILAVLMLLAMAATLLFGTGRSRHGYGLHPAAPASVLCG